MWLVATCWIEQQLQYTDIIKFSSSLLNVLFNVSSLFHYYHHTISNILQSPLIYSSRKKLIIGWTKPSVCTQSIEHHRRKSHIWLPCFTLASWPQISDRHIALLRNLITHSSSNLLNHSLSLHFRCFRLFSSFPPSPHLSLSADALLHYSRSDVTNVTCLDGTLHFPACLIQVMRPSSSLKPRSWL